MRKKAFDDEKGTGGEFGQLSPDRPLNDNTRTQERDVGVDKGTLPGTNDVCGCGGCRLRRLVRWLERA